MRTIPQDTNERIERICFIASFIKVDVMSFQEVRPTRTDCDDDDDSNDDSDARCREVVNECPCSQFSTGSGVKTRQTFT